MGYKLILCKTNAFKLKSNNKIAFDSQSFDSISFFSDFRAHQNSQLDEKMYSK